MSKTLSVSDQMQMARMKEGGEFFSFLMDGIIKKQNVPISCARGCAACCYEPLYAEKSEALIAKEALKKLPHRMQKAVKKRVREWVERFKNSPVFGDRMPHRLKYRAVGLPCPFLDREKRECMIYDDRPFGCRAHYAVSPAENCSDTTGDREIILAKPGVEVDMVMAKAVFTPGGDERMVMDHFGLLLGEVFFGESHESGSREEHALSDYDEDFWSDRMRALVIDDAAKARVKEVLDFAMKKENWWTLGEGTPPGDREGFVTELDTFRVVFSITVVEGKPHRHISISVPRNLPHPIAAFTIAGMFGFTGGKQENDVCVGPGPDWQVGPHEKERAVMMLQPLEQK